MSGMTLSEHQALYSAVTAAPSVAAPVRRPLFGRADETEGAQPAQQTASKTDTTIAAVERKLLATVARSPALLSDAAGLEPSHFVTAGLDKAFEVLRAAQSGDLDLLRHRWAEKGISGATVDAILGSPVASTEDVGALTKAVRDSHRERCITAAALAIHETPADPEAHEGMRQALEQGSGADASAFVGPRHRAKISRRTSSGAKPARFA